MIRYFCNEKGATIVVVALVMVVLIGFTALSVDGGYLYFRHTKLQDIADALALAGANQMAETQGGENNKKSEAFKEAVEYADKNKLKVVTKYSGTYSADIVFGENETGKMIVEFPTGVEEVKVNLKINAKNYFAKVFGSNFSSVGVSATAMIGQAAKQTGGLVPVGIVGDDPTDPSDDYIPGVQYNMTLGPSAGSSGNYGYLDFEPSSYFNDYLEYGYDGTLKVGDTVNTYTGVNVGLVANSLGERVAGDTCTYDSHTEDCPRLIYTPIVDKYGESGSSYVTIIGFAAFFLEDYIHDGNNITLVGRFMEKVAPEAITPSSLGYTTHAVRLVD